MKSAVLPKIIKLLGSESHLLSGIYPRILPLVHEIPQEALEDFYGDILDAIKSGLKTFVITSTPRNIAKASTQSGGSACVMAYFEVALHCLKNSNEAKHAQIFDQVSNASTSQMYYARQIRVALNQNKTSTIYHKVRKRSECE